MIVLFAAITGCLFDWQEPFVIVSLCELCIIARCMEIPEWTGTDWNGPERTGMDRNGPEWTKTDRNGPEDTTKSIVLHPLFNIRIEKCLNIFMLAYSA